MISRAGSHAAGPLIMKAKNHALAGLKPSEVILRRLNCFWLGLIRESVPMALIHFTDFVGLITIKQMIQICRLQILLTI